MHIVYVYTYYIKNGYVIKNLKTFTKKKKKRFCQLYINLYINIHTHFLIHNYKNKYITK